MLRKWPHRDGFTIVEIMVAIGVIGVLLALIFPALMNTRAAARETISLSHARGVAMSMQAYADSFGRWPFAKAGQPTPGVPAPTLLPEDQIVLPTWPPGSFISFSDHWSLSRFWPGLLGSVAPWEEHAPTWISPGGDSASFSLLENNTVVIALLNGSSYVYSNAFIASPAIWRGSALASEALIGPTRPSDVAHPGGKVLVWDGDLAYVPHRPDRIDGHWRHPTPMAFADMHAAVHNPLDATPGAPNPLNNDNDTRLHNTPAGVLGRDY